MQRTENRQMAGKGWTKKRSQRKKSRMNTPTGTTNSRKMCCLEAKRIVSRNGEP